MCDLFKLTEGEGWGTGGGRDDRLYVHLVPATSVLQHAKLSEQIHPTDTLAHSWDDMQATNNLPRDRQVISLFCQTQ